MIGMYAEPKPKGFGFSDTAFRVFILMASRRLKSDRFFTRDYRPEVYTQAGLDWVEDNAMRSVLLRHFPELAPALRASRTRSRRGRRAEVVRSARRAAGRRARRARRRSGSSTARPALVAPERSRGGSALDRQRRRSTPGGCSGSAPC